MENQDEQEVIVEEGEVMQKEFEFTPTGTCRFRQRGPYLVCVSCEVQHATWIGMDKIMTGEDENGKPIGRSRSTV